VDKRLYILKIAKETIGKELEKAQKRVDATSNKLYHMDMHNTSVRARANARSGLSIHCEQRDRIQSYLDEIDKWEDEL
jgi:hypothetical protein